LRFYEPLFKNVLFPLYETVLRGRKTLAHLNEYEQNQWLSADEIEALQWDKLKRLIDHCWREVPYYQRTWKALGITPSDLRSLTDYKSLPTLEKAEIRENFEDLHAQSWRGRLLYKSTGGSTGEPLRFGYTRESYERRLAVMWRGYGWAGARMGRRTLFLWGGGIGNPTWLERTKERLYHLAFNRRMLDVFRMSESGMHEYADAIRRFQPDIIVGYAGPLHQLAVWMTKTGQRAARPKAILSAAESLEEYQRTTIESAFGCPVYNTYGCREFMLIASQCGLCGELHVSADHLLVELCQSRTAADGQETGDIVITDLHNWGMPLLRYRNGDMATRAPHRAHSCAIGLPTLQRIEGRTLDMLLTRDGRLLPGEFFPHLLKDVPGVVRYQVIQERLDAFTLLVVPAGEFGVDQENSIRAELAKVLGSGTALEIRRVDDIPLTPSGKRRVTISRLP
jgi:phenylacetate-CoA ligase